MKKLKVLASAYAFNPAGSLQLHPGEDIVGWKIVEQLSRFHEVWVITHTANKKAVEEALSEGQLNGVHIHYVNLPFNLRKILYKTEIGQRIYYYLWQIAAWLKAKKLHKQFHFDVAQHITFNNDWIPSFIGAYLPVPFVWGPVGGGQRTPKAFMKGFSFAGRAADRIRLFGQWIGRHLLIARKRCVKRAGAILVCNRETKEKIPEKYRNKVCYFPVNGISTNDLVPFVQKRPADKPFRVITAGRMVHWKNFGEAIKAFGLFAGESPHSLFTIIGEGPELSLLKKLAENLGVQEKIKFIPWIPRKELFEKMTESHVFLFPSLREGGGAVVVEAMACGIPVICLNNAGPGYHIQEKWGIKIDPLNPESIIKEMAKALKQLYRDENLRHRLAEASLIRAEDFYVWDRQGERLQSIYDEALKRMA